MLIKYQALATSLHKEKSAIYFLFGQDHYLLNDSAKTIKSTWHSDSDTRAVYLETASDWSMLFEEANSYSLFSKFTLIDAHFDKKSFDATSKDAINAYLKNSNDSCLIIIRAPNVPVKQLQWIATHRAITVVHASSFDKVQWQRFISDKLKAQSLQFEPSIPALIYQYTQGNLLASMQLIDKLAILYDGLDVITGSMVSEQLIDQCEYQLYELADACLHQNGDKAIHLLRQAQANRVEPTLILWLLTQEIRQLIQLSYLIAQSIPMSVACQKLNIWNQKVPLYAKMITKLSISSLRQLLCMSQEIDEHIKSSQNKHIWQKLEYLALQLALSSPHQAMGFRYATI